MQVTITDSLMANSPEEYESQHHPPVDPDHLSSLLKRISHGDVPEYVPAGERDVRCGCPALNALANHSYM